MVYQMDEAKMQSSILRPLTEVQRDLWDTFVAEHPQGHLLQSWGWGELKGRSGWSPLRLVLWNKEQDRILAAAQILRCTAPHVPLWAGHLAYIPKGPVIDWNQTKLVDSFFAQLNPYLAKQGAIALRIELGQEVDSPEQNIVQSYLDTFDFHPVHAIQPKRTILVDLTPNENTILSRLKKDCRYSVRMSARRGVQVRLAQSSDDIRGWYSLMEVTSSRKQFGIHTLDYYLNAWRIFSPLDQGCVLLAEYEGKLLAGIFVSVFAQQGYYLYAGSSNEHRNLLPSYLLQWEGMRWAKERGARSYDLWGIPETDDDNDPMAGVHRFKTEWGGRGVSFMGGYERVYRPLAMNMVSRLISF